MCAVLSDFTAFLVRLKGTPQIFRSSADIMRLWIVPARKLAEVFAVYRGYPGVLGSVLLA